MSLKLKLYNHWTYQQLGEIEIHLLGFYWLKENDGDISFMCDQDTEDHTIVGIQLLGFTLELEW